MSHRHATHHCVPITLSLDGAYRRTILDAHLLVGIAYDACHIIGAGQGSEAGTVEDVTILGIAHDASHTSFTFQVVSTIKDEIGNDGMLHDRTLCHAHEGQTIDAPNGTGNAADTVAIAIEHALERMVGVAQG